MSTHQRYDSSVENRKKTFRRTSGLTELEEGEGLEHNKVIQRKEQRCLIGKKTLKILSDLETELQIKKKT